MVVLEADLDHGLGAARVGIIVRDDMQGQGLGRELLIHAAGAAIVNGHGELIAYTATSVGRAKQFFEEVGVTKSVNDKQNPHLHTLLPESAALGIGAVRERLAS